MPGWALLVLSWCLLLCFHFSNLSVWSWLHQLSVVELGGPSLIRLSQGEIESDGGFPLLALGIASFRVSKQTPASSSSSWPDPRRTSTTSIFPKSDVDGLIFSAALLVGLRGRWRGGVEGWEGDERHFSRLCHLTLSVRQPGTQNGERRTPVGHRGARNPEMVDKYS